MRSTLATAAALAMIGCNTGSGDVGKKVTTDSGAYIGTATGGGPSGGTVSGYLLVDQRIDGGGDLATDPISDSVQMCALDGGGLVVAWVDDRGGDRGIWAVASDDGGQTWPDPVQVNDDPAWADFPSLACAGDNAYLAWEDRRNSEVERSHVFFSRSTDGGASWSPNQQLAGDPDGLFDHLEPVVAAQGSQVHVVWSTEIAGAPDVFVSSSSDSGASFTDQRIDGGLPGDAWSGHANIGFGGSNEVIVAWEDRRNLVNDIYVAASGNGGGSFSSPVRVDSGSGNSFSPQIAAGDGHAYVLWHDQEGVNPLEVYSAYSTNGGTSFSAAVKISEGAEGDSVLPQATLAGGTLHATWFQGMGGGFHVVYKQLSGGTEVGPQTKLDHSADLTQAIYPRVAQDGQSVVVAWRDDRNTSTEDHDDLFYAHSTDGGATWSDTDLRIDSHDGPTAERSDLQLLAQGDALTAVWTDHRDGTPDIYFIRLPLGDAGLE